MDTSLYLTAGKQWPAFAVGPDGLLVAAIDPPRKSGRIQKIAYNGGLMSVEH